MKPLLTITFSLFLSFFGSIVAQPHFAKVLRDVENNNATLRAAQCRSEARQAEIESGMLIDDPKVDAAYYQGDPSNIGVRWDFSVSQSFEMPSVIIRRQRLLDLEQQAAQLDYEALRVSILLETQHTCADLIYHRAVSDIYSRRCVSAIQLAQLYQQRLSTGDCSILEYNRAQMYMADMQNQAAESALLADHATHDLGLLTGNESYYFTDTEYEPVGVEPSFEEWYERLEMNNPALRIIDNQLSSATETVELKQFQWLPSVEVGYASENVIGSTFRGVTLGLTIPIFSQQRATRAAKLQAQAASQQIAAERTRLFEETRCMFHRHEALIRNLNNLRNAFDSCNSINLLDKALAAGEINLEQYLQQVDYYYSIELQIWQLAHELEILHINLYSIEL